MGTQKVELAKRRILSVRRAVNVDTFPRRWPVEPFLFLAAGALLCLRPMVRAGGNLNQKESAPAMIYVWFWRVR